MINGQPSGKFGQGELAKLITIATFLASSGILTSITGYLTSLNMGKWGTITMAAWNLFLAIIYLVAKDNTPLVAKIEDQAGKNP